MCEYGGMSLVRGTIGGDSLVGGYLIEASSHQDNLVCWLGVV